MFQSVWGGRPQRPQNIAVVGFIGTLQEFGLLNLQNIGTSHGFEHPGVRKC